jgi:hypothetical protein
MEENSLQSFPAFIEWCEQNRGQETMTSLLNNLRGEKIPTSPKFRAKALRAIKMALRSLFLIVAWMNVERSYTKLDGYPHVISGMVHKSWHAIWDWVSFLHMHCIVEQSLGKTLEIASLHAIPLALGSLGWHAGLRKSMLRTPGLLAILVRHWVKEDTYLQLAELEWHTRDFAIALDQLLTYEQKEDRDVIVAMADVVEGGPETASRIALEQLSAQLPYIEDENSHHLPTVCFNLMIIHHLSSGSSPANLQLLLCNGLAPIIAKFLNILRPKTYCEESEVPPVIDHCMLATFSIVSTILLSANGPAWVAQLIDAGLVSGILSSGLWLQHLASDLPTSISSGVFGRLREYLVYRSVLRSIKNKMLKEVRCIKDTQHLSEPLWQEYLVFEKLALQRLEIKASFDKEVALGLEPGYLGCENRDVSIHIPK